MTVEPSSLPAEPPTAPPAAPPAEPRIEDMAAPPSAPVMATIPGPRAPCEVARRPRTEAGERRGRAVADCVEGWLEGEVQQFRDGVKREVDEFRAGFDRFRRGVRQFGSKIRGSD
jgi:hypothetical protein